MHTQNKRMKTKKMFSQIPFLYLIIFFFFCISGELSTEAINHDTAETRISCATRRGKYFVHTF